MNLPADLTAKYRQLQHRIRAHGRLAIAFSGGVDSTLLLKITHDTLGPANTVAFYADTPVQPASDRQKALTMAHAIGAELRRVDCSPLAIPEFASNGARRCYHCKRYIFSTLLELALRLDFPLLADGTNLDDLGMDRPGLQALSEFGVQSPLAEAGLTKHDIRQLSRRLGLATWNKPTASCLATRIECGIPITLDSLALIDRAEEYLHRLGYQGCRVRLTEKAFILELAGGDIARAAHHDDLNRMRLFLNTLAAKKVLLDLLERESILS